MARGAHFRVFGGGIGSITVQTSPRWPSSSTVGREKDHLLHFHPPYRGGINESTTFSWGPLPGFPRHSRLIFSPLRPPQLMMGVRYENGLGDQPRAARPRSRKVTQKPVPGISLRAYPCTVCGKGRAPGRLRAKTASPAAETPQIRNLHAPRGPMVGALWACNASRPWHISHCAQLCGPSPVP